jgi:hypothetical protein|tara:strand:- start:6980 stop:7399 length:420 start_codon:yes stop_codon:yes gene_type:complete
MKENDFREFSSEELEKDRYRIVQLTTGETIIGKILNATAYGMLLKNPVVCSTENSEVFFTVLFNGMSKSRNYFFGVTHILTVGLVDEDIKQYYERYLKDTYDEYEEFKTSNESEYEYNAPKPTSNAMARLLDSIKGTMH